MTPKRCFACNQPLGNNPLLVTCADEQDVFVGSECARRIRRAGRGGWQPPRGGSRLYTLMDDPKGRPGFKEVGERLDRTRQQPKEPVR